MPIRIKDNKSYKYLAYDDPQIQLLPVKAKSLRILAENFRWVVKHIQTFSRSKIIPTYTKQGTSSLTRLGFTNDHESGISRRPQLPNAVETYSTLHTMLKTMPHDPPFNTDVLLPSLPQNVSPPPWPQWPEVDRNKADAFLQHVRYALYRKKDFDTIAHPSGH